MALAVRKKPVLGQKNAANNFFDADYHFEHIELDSKILINNQMYQ